MAGSVSMHIVKPVFSDYLLVVSGLQNYVYSKFLLWNDAYRFFQISKTLNWCALERLQDLSLFTGNIFMTDVYKQFTFVRWRIILILNNVLKRSEGDSIPFKLRRSVSKAGTVEKYDLTFWEIGFPDLILAKIFACLEHI